MSSAAQRRERLAAARLYFVTDGGTDLDVIAAALEAGADIIQLRDASLPDDEFLSRAGALRTLCDHHGALFFVNDRPDLALAAGADGVHVGQEDMSVEDARLQSGGELLVGRSTHDPRQLAEAVAARADQISVGPVWETPSKPGRPAVGLDYVRHAASQTIDMPWFAIGGIDETNVHEVVAAGARRIVVLRALRDAADPAAAASRLRAALDRSEVGAAQ